MPEPAHEAGAADGLFDRYMLPKAALTVILAASLVGTWVTTVLAGSGGPVRAVAKWAYLVALGVLTGGLLWKHAFVRPADLDEGAGEYCAAMYDRFDRIAAAALIVLVAGAIPVLGQYVSRLGRTPAVVALGAVLIGWVTLTTVTLTREATVDEQFRSAAGVSALAFAVLALGVTAAAEVALRGGDPLAVGVRVLHLLAFAVWIGGAVWNIFVAVPTGKQRSTIPVVQAAGEQLERFRWAVRLIIPTLLLTGLYQAVDALGAEVGTYLGSTVGLAVLAKVGAIGLLVVIFLTCPMWRACSPIEGVCDLEELGGTAAAEAGKRSQADASGSDGSVTDDD